MMVMQQQDILLDLIRKYAILETRAQAPYWDQSRHPARYYRSFAKAGFSSEDQTSIARWQYVVPSRRVAYIEFITLSLLRKDAPTSVDRVRALISMYFKRAPLEVFTPISRSFVSAMVGAGIEDTIPPFVLQEGDQISASTQDQSTGGSIDWNISMVLTECDAGPDLQEFV